MCIPVSTVCVGHMELWRRKRNVEAERERERWIFHPLVSSPDGHSSTNWVGLKLEARSTFWILHASAGAQSIGPFAVFPRH